MTARKFAQRLLFKAEQDLMVLKKLQADPDIAAEVLGFHAQQSAEKMLKAVLAVRQIKFPFTHRLTELMDAIKAGGIPFPEEFEELRYLTPFAVEFRYDFLGDDDDTFDIPATVALLEAVHRWASPFIADKL